MVLALHSRSEVTSVPAAPRMVFFMGSWRRPRQAGTEKRRDSRRRFEPGRPNSACWIDGMLFSESTNVPKGQSPRTTGFFFLSVANVLQAARVTLSRRTPLLMFVGTSIAAIQGPHLHFSGFGGTRPRFELYSSASSTPMRGLQRSERFRSHLIYTVIP
jgi:hypothetical protein